MQIGEVAARTELSLRTIRHYEETGLVIPSARSQGGFRLYTEADVARLMVIRRMKPLGFTLDEMRDLLDATDRLDSGEQPPPAEREELLDTHPRVRAGRAAAGRGSSSPARSGRGIRGHARRAAHTDADALSGKTTPLASTRSAASVNAERSPPPPPP